MAPGGASNSVEGPLAGPLVAAQQQPALTVLLARRGIKADERPVVPAVPLGALSRRDALPRPRRDPPEQGIGTLAGTADGDAVVTGNRNT